MMDEEGWMEFLTKDLQAGRKPADRYPSQGNPTYSPLRDVVRCLVFLSSNKEFEKSFLDFDRNFVQLNNSAGTLGIHKVLTGYLVDAHGFENIPKLQFFAKAPEFVRAVRQGCSFKDSLSLIHGEYSHLIQWCILGWARDQGAIRLDSGLKKIYMSLVEAKALSSLEFDGEFSKRARDQRVKHQVFLWDLVCDCINPRASDPTPNDTENIFSSSYRSPAYLMDALVGEYESAEDLRAPTHDGRRLRSSYISRKLVRQHAQDRHYAMRRQGEKTEELGEALMQELQDEVEKVKLGQIQGWAVENADATEVVVAFPKGQGFKDPIFVGKVGIKFKYSPMNYQKIIGKSVHKHFEMRIDQAYERFSGSKPPWAKKR